MSAGGFPPMRKLAPVLLLFASVSVHASTCLGTVSVCSSFEKSGVVYRGRVLEIEHGPARASDVITYPDGSTALSGYQEISADFRIEVLEVFKGNPGTPGSEIIVSAGPQHFEVGKEYVIFSDPTPDMKAGQIGICIMDHSIENPNQDTYLTWLRAYRTAPPTSNIFGNVSMGYLGKEIPSIKITISGPQNRTTYSGEDHSYSFDGLPPGTYTLKATAPEGYAASEKDTATVTVAAKGCARIDWDLELDTHVRGRVTDKEGAPVSGARVGLLRPEENRTGFGVVATQATNAEGKYDFSKVQVGDYLIGLYYMGPTNNYPHTAVFYPSGTVPSSGQLIHLGPDGNVENVDLVASPTLHPVSLHVHVVNPDGSPVIQAHVTANDPTTPINALTAIADDNGDADITLYEGQEYRLIASTSGYREPVCGGPIKFIAKDGLQLGTIKLDKSWDDCRALQRAK
jgi:hypothetical protein